MSVYAIRLTDLADRGPVKENYLSDRNILPDTVVVVDLTPSTIMV